MFVSAWSLQNESRFSICNNAVKFARHALPPAIIVDMEAMSSPNVTHNMSYVATQVMFYLVASARQMQLLNEMEVARTGCGVQEVNLKRWITELEKDVHGFDQRYALLASDKTAIQEI